MKSLSEGQVLMIFEILQTRNLMLYVNLSVPQQQQNLLLGELLSNLLCFIILLLNA